MPAVCYATITIFITFSSLLFRHLRRLFSRHFRHYFAYAFYRLIFFRLRFPARVTEVAVAYRYAIVATPYSSGAKRRQWRERRRRNAAAQRRMVPHGGKKRCRGAREIEIIYRHAL